MRSKFISLPCVCLFILIVLTVLSCTEDNDINQTRSVEFSNLEDDQVVSGVVNVTLDIEGSGTPEKIKIFQGETLLETLTTQPYTFAWNTTLLEEGNYVLTALATYSTGRQVETSVRITVEHMDVRTLLTVEVPDNFLDGDGRPDAGYIIVSDASWNLIASGELHNGQSLTLSSEEFDEERFTITEIYIKENKITATSYLRIGEGSWTLNNPYQPQVQRNPVRLSFNFFTSGADYSISTNANFTSPFVFSNTLVNETNPGARDLDLSVSPGKLFVRRSFQNAFTFRLLSSDAIAKGGAYLVDLSQINDLDTRYRLQTETIDVPGSNTVIRVFGLPQAGNLHEAFLVGTFGQFEQSVGILVPQAEVDPFTEYFSVTSYRWQNQEIENASFGKSDVSKLDVTATVSNVSETGLMLTTTGTFDFFELEFAIGNNLPFSDGTWRVIGPSVTGQVLRTPTLPANISEALDFTDFGMIEADASIRLLDYTTLDRFEGVVNFIKGSDHGLTSLANEKEKRQVRINLE